MVSSVIDTAFKVPMGTPGNIKSCLELCKSPTGLYLGLDTIRKGVKAPGVYKLDRDTVWSEDNRAKDRILGPPAEQP